MSRVLAYPRAKLARPCSSCARVFESGGDEPAPVGKQGLSYCPTSLPVTEGEFGRLDVSWVCRWCSGATRKAHQWTPRMLRLMIHTQLSRRRLSWRLRESRHALSLSREMASSRCTVDFRPPWSAWAVPKHHRCLPDQRFDSVALRRPRRLGNRRRSVGAAGAARCSVLLGTPGAARQRSPSAPGPWRF